MKLILGAGLVALPLAFAHTQWTTFYVDGVSQGDGTAIRMRRDFDHSTYPLDNYASNDMACNVNGTTGVPRVAAVPDGSTLTFEMRSWPDDPTKPPLDRPHKGPCAIYMKKVDSAIKDTAAGNGWFKLYASAYDNATDTWCTDHLIDNKGHFSIKLPQGLQGGYYLARPEVLALHNATNGDGQFYAGCAQIFLQSNGNLGPDKTISIPGDEYVKAGDPSVQFNIWEGKNINYRAPGPAVANLVPMSSIAGGDTSSTTGSTLTQSEGLFPADCIAKNANWCGTEVSSYTNETGCWASSAECWKQSDACWAGTPPSGGKGCVVWAAKCQGINDACTAKNWDGPPGKGNVLTPEEKKTDVGSLVMDFQGQVEGAGAANANPAANSVKSAASSAFIQGASTSAPGPAMSSPAAMNSSPGPASFAPAPTSLSTVAVAAPPSSSAPLYVPSSWTTPDPAMFPTPTSQPEMEKGEGGNGKGKGKCPAGFRCVTQVTTEVVRVTATVTMDG